MRTGLQMLDMPESYFEQSEDSTAEAESHEETRYAGLAEVIHTAHHVQLYDWENTRKAENSKKNPLKGHVANMAFFSLFDCTPKNGPVTTLRYVLVCPLELRFSMVSAEIQVGPCSLS